MQRKQRCEGRSLKIDPDKLLRILEQRDLYPQEVSEELGYGRGYIKDVLRRSLISKPGMIALESMFNIRYEDIKQDDVRHLEIVKDPNERTVSELTSDEFGRIIYRAVYAAVKNATKDNSQTDTKKGE